MGTVLRVRARASERFNARRKDWGRGKGEGGSGVVGEGRGVTNAHGRDSGTNSRIHYTTSKTIVSADFKLTLVLHNYVDSFLRFIALDQSRTRVSPRLINKQIAWEFLRLCPNQTSRMNFEQQTSF